MADIDVAHEYFTWELVQQVAEENGYFEEAGVETDLSYFAPGTQDFSDQGANAYETDWWDELDDQGETHGVCEWNAIQETSETDRQIIGSYSEWDRVLFTAADADLDSVEDLKGRSIGINEYATSFYSIPEMLEHEGFDESEIVLEHIGSAEDRFDAVKAGEVDAIGVLEPYVTLGKYDEELTAVYEGPCRAALVAPAEIDPDQVDAFRTALNRAVANINDDLDRYREEYVDLLEAAAAEDEAAFADVDFDRLRTDFELRNFLPVRAPDEDRIEGTTEWMRDKGFVADDAEIDTVEADDETADEDEAEATAD